MSVKLTYRIIKKKLVFSLHIDKLVRRLNLYLRKLPIGQDKVFWLGKNVIFYYDLTYTPEGYNMYNPTCKMVRYQYEVK